MDRIPAPALPAQPPANRRLAITALGSLGMASLLGCGGGSDATSTTDTSTGTGTGTATGTGTGTATGSGSGTTGTGTGTTTTCSVAPEETAGPYPADGSTASNNTYNVLALSGIVRSDIRSSIGSSTQVAGVPLTITITLTNTKASCAPLAGYAIYLWHCTQDGNYSVYTSNNIADNHLRGVQATDASGTVTFTTIVPGCYAGRMPHMHLEVYPTLASATKAANKVKTTQLAFPTAMLSSIYNSNTGYSASVRNLAAISFATDNVFSDGTDLEMTTMQANTGGGYAASITLSIAA
ncbi:intradiol ring-cleavage dioxygenase [Acidovorax sp. FJL06]|uniref:dioxygenase family protein n=1 Tax=Acidovorax sp. FJL06 TaxID=2153365 RepID=UPI000F562AE2|nr:intradiol ring-cleavage dioxygenase [Acidovorax sp. FJL06]RQO82343.1 intradiol ring-cleavage dioxygenase [Acidovorax sp. FJL06]